MRGDDGSDTINMNAHTYGDVDGDRTWPGTTSLHNDNITLDGSGSISVHGNVGQDTITVKNHSANCEAYGDEGTDYLIAEANGSGVNDGVVFYGGADNDNIKGGAGNDLLYGDGGNDDIYGRAGDDALTGGSGAVWMNGDGGNDSLYAADGERDRGIWGSTGSDIFWVDAEDMAAPTRIADFTNGTDSWGA